MTGVYAPFLYAGGGHCLKHHLLLFDDSGSVISIEPFQGETERTIAYSGMILPAFPETVANTPEEALSWLSERLNKEQGATMLTILDGLFPQRVLVPGQSVRLWNVEGVYPDTHSIDPECVLRPIYL